MTNTQERPLSKRTREQVDVIASLIVAVTQDAVCCCCGRTMSAIDMSFDVEHGEYVCDGCVPVKRCSSAHAAQGN